MEPKRSSSFSERGLPSEPKRHKPQHLPFSHILLHGRLPRPQPVGPPHHRLIHIQASHSKHAETKCKLFYIPTKTQLCESEDAWAEEAAFEGLHAGEPEGTDGVYRVEPPRTDATTRLWVYNLCQCFWQSTGECNINPFMAFLVSCGFAHACGIGPHA
jgi:hypothetical protein